MFSNSLQAAMAMLFVLALVFATPSFGGSTAIELGPGDEFTVQDDGGTPLFNVDSSGTVFPEFDSYARTVIVSPAGTEIQNGDALRDALADIIDASASNRYLVKIEPGIYQVGVDAIDMKEFVDIEGSGQGITTIRGTGGGSPAEAPVMRGASNTQLRSLTLESISGDTTAVGYYTGTGTSVKLQDVTLKASNAGSFGYGFYALSCTEAVLERVTVIVENNVNGSIGIGPFLCDRVTIRNSKATATSSGSFSSGVNTNSLTTSLWNVETSATGASENFGIHSSKSDLDVHYSRASAGPAGVNSHGLFLDDDGGASVLYAVTVQHSQLLGDEAAANTAVETELQIAASQLSGGVQGSANLTCAGVYDGAFAFFASSCP